MNKSHQNSFHRFHIGYPHLTWSKTEDRAIFPIGFFDIFPDCTLSKYVAEM